jgi:predicted permease
MTSLQVENLPAAGRVSPIMDSPLPDLQFAIRQLRKSPAFAITAILSLAVGLAASTTVFSLADALLFRSRPGIANPDRLVDIGRTTHGGGFDTISYPNYVDMCDQNQVFDGVAAYQIEPVPLGLDARGSVDRVYGAAVSGNYFKVLGVTPARGRFFLPAEERVTEPGSVAVISHRLWRRRFNLDPSIIGSVVRLNNRPVTLAGIAPEEFVGTSVLAPDVWLPLSMRPELSGGDANMFNNRRAVWLMAFARLRPSVSMAEAQASIGVLAERLARDYPEANAGKGIRLAPSHRLVGQLKGPVTLFMTVLALLAGLVMMIACSNVAGMLLTRATARRRELAVRLALGAGRPRLVRQLLTETLLIFVLGGLGGVLLSWWATVLVQSFLPALPVPVLVDLRLDRRVLAVGLGLSLLTGVVFGLLPALRASRVELTPLIKGYAGEIVRHIGLRSVFVVGQVAMALVLLVAASLFLRSLQRAAAIDPGFRPDGVDVVFLDLRMGGYTPATSRAFVDRLLERLRGQPGVERAAVAGVVPMGGDGLSFGGVRAPGQYEEGRPAGLEADWNVVTADYFRTLEIPMVGGRGFTPGDGGPSSLVAIINQTMAKRLWPGQDAVGRSFEVVGPRGVDSTLQVIGVVRDAKYRWIGDSDRLFVYVPFGQQHYDRQAVLVRRGHPSGGGRPAHGEALESAVPVVRRVLAEIDPALPIIEVTTLEDYAKLGLLPQRLASWAAGGLGVVGLLLAALGIYGVTAYNAAQRTREIGIRIALGAGRAALTRLMLWQGFRLAVAGAAIGLAGAAAVGELVRSLLLGVGSLDPTAFAAASALFVGITLAASWLPARRASSRDAVEALRVE